MLNEKQDDTFLSRWITNELTDKELIDFEKSPDYKEYQKIIEKVDLLEVPEYDLDNALSKIKRSNSTKIQKQNKPIVKLLPYFAVAASIAIILGFFFFKPSLTSHSTSFGEQLAITLPDGSEIILNAKSDMSYNEKNWNKNRSLKLEGEAYFKVAKGSKFTVVTPNGNVAVLGTQFDVQSNGEFFKAICYEGKVQVVSGNFSEILTPGKGFQKNTRKEKPTIWTLTNQEPTWINKTSSFNSSPVNQVFKALENQYNITIEYKDQDIISITKYTGTFPNDNLNIALKTVFTTLDFQYHLNQKERKVVLKK